MLKDPTPRTAAACGMAILLTERAFFLLLLSQWRNLSRMHKSALAVEFPEPDVPISISKVN